MTAAPREPSQRFARLAAAIRKESTRLARVVDEAAEARADFAAAVPPPRELRGIGAILHDFYTGVEHVFEKVAPELNGGVPSVQSWHRALLGDMTLDLPGVRPALLGQQTARLLDEFLRFRHLFRNAYGFGLDWERIQPLLERLPQAWQAFRADLDRFLTFLDTIAAPEG